MEICIEVQGLPPKKDGANSMWRRRPEADRVKALRSAALEQMRGRAPFPVDARLSVYIEVHIGPVNGRAVGDLDNFVTGVLDALQAAPAGLATQQGLIPQTTPYGGAIVFEDDASVVHLEARKVVGVEDQHYTVRVGVER